MDTVQIPEINILPYQKNAADYNMALDEHLMSLSGTYLRFYGWEPTTLSLGRLNQHDDVDLQFCKKNGIRLIKRRSGGKAILHQHELTYAFITDAGLFPMSVRDSYRLITQPIANGLRKLSLSPEMKDAEKAKDTSSICFKEVSAYELTVGSKKIVGSAQFRRRRRFCQHGSILLDADWSLWKKIWGIPEDSQILEKRITSLKKELVNLPEIETIQQILIDEFLASFGARKKLFKLNVEDKIKLQELKRDYTWAENS